MRWIFRSPENFNLQFRVSKIPVNLYEFDAQLFELSGV